MAYGVDFFPAHTPTESTTKQSAFPAHKTTPSPKATTIDPFPAHKVTPAATTPLSSPNDSSGALSYIGEHLIYIAVFIFLTLIIYWTIGNKGTFYFLMLVLSGQLVFNADEITSLFPKEG